MKKITLTLVLLMFSFFNLYSQNIFKKAKANSETREFSRVHELPVNTTFYTFDYDLFVSSIADAPKRGDQSIISKPKILLPNSEGEMVKYNVIEASSFTPEMQERFPEIRAYAGNGVDNSYEYLRFSISPYKGLDVTVLNVKEGTQIIAAVSKNLVAVYNRAERTTRPNFECTTADKIGDSENVSAVDNASKNADDGILRTFETAIAVTGEYTAYHGGTVPSAVSAVNASLTRINSVYEQEFSVTMLLVDNTNIIYTNAATDPFTGNYNSELSALLDAQYPGGAGYDVGHVFVLAPDNGNAGCIGCICQSGGGGPHKGSAFTAASVPTGDRFDIDYVAHEYGHQFGGEHTFTHTPNHSNVSMMEPGSGTTIMGYAGITGATDVQKVSDPYFHAVSIDQITNHIKTRSCDVETATGNATPVIPAQPNITLPIGTAFRLEAIPATDANAADVLTYCWEQYDENNGADAYPDPASTNSDRPLFRSYIPTTSTIRTFPKLADLVANGVNGNTWEKVPTVARTADFRLTVRDNSAGGAANEHVDMVVTWDATKGPLAVTSQAATGIVWNQGNTETITWDVNSTNTMSGASNVNILLSIDGGVTYPTTLASNIPNNGMYNITVPNSPAPYCRVIVQPTNAPFFSVNTTDFAIDYDVQTVTNCNTYDSGTINLAIPDGTGANTQGAVVGSTINIPDNVMISDVNVYFDVTHTYAQDLILLINNVNDQDQVQVVARVCGAEDGINATFDDQGAAIVCGGNGTVIGNPGIYQPSNALSTFNGKMSGGNWDLLAVDFYNGDTGQVNSFSIEICETTTTATPLSVKDNDFALFNVYPNPSNGNVNITLSSSEDVQVSLHDIRGRQVYTKLHNNNSVTFAKTIDFSTMAAGVYLLNVESGSKRATKKLVIQ